MNLTTDSFYTLLFIGILIMLVLALGLIIFFYSTQRRLLRQQARQQELELQYQKDLLYSTITTQEEERKRIAKDLHDDIGSKLNVVILSLYRLQKQTKELPKAATTINTMNELLNTTITTTRRISHDLLPPTLDKFGLTAALNELSESYNNTDTVTIDFDDSQASERLKDKLIELNLFRVIQELIKNSILHGKAKNITLQLQSTATKFSITYTDDGQGFDVAAVQKNKGLGTQNIESRLNMSNASITYQSAIGEGVKAYIISTIAATAAS